MNSLYGCSSPDDPLPQTLVDNPAAPPRTHLRALVGPDAKIRTQLNPRTGGIATKVTIGNRTGWLSCTRDEILRYAAYDGCGRALPPLPSTGMHSHWRLATQAQVVAIYVRGQSLRQPSAPDPYVIQNTWGHWNEARV
jgi:hypothetical protein